METFHGSLLSLEQNSNFSAWLTKPGVTLVLQLILGLISSHLPLFIAFWTQRLPFSSCSSCLGPLCKVFPLPGLSLSRFSHGCFSSFEYHFPRETLSNPIVIFSYSTHFLSHHLVIFSSNHRCYLKLSTCFLSISSTECKLSKTKTLSTLFFAVTLLPSFGCTYG